MHAIVNNRPDYSFVVNKLAQYLSNLGVVHIQALKHVMQYIKSILTIGIKYQKCRWCNFTWVFQCPFWVGNKVVWLFRLLNELGFSQNQPITIYLNI